MKKTIFIGLLLIASLCKAQDTINVLNLSLTTRTVAILASTINDPSDDSQFSVFLKWRAALRANPAAAAIVTDTMPTVLLANMYNFALHNQDGFNLGNSLKTQMASARTANSYLDGMCTAFEANYQAQIADRVKMGRRLLLGK